MKDTIKQNLDIINSTIVSDESKIDEFVNMVYVKFGNLPFIEYYSHEGTQCFKIKNKYTLFMEEVIVLGRVDEGFRKAIAVALSWKKR